MNPAAAWRLALAGAVLVLVTGCATVPGATMPTATAGAQAQSPDPWERINRKIFGFNERVDELVLKPVATAYRDVVPALVRQGVSNVLGNIGDVWSAANHLLQGKVHHGLDMGMRVLTNTLFGLGGVLDPASEMGLVRRSEDFGQTLGRWGVGAGPYIVLPLLGPSSVRDGSAFFLLDRRFAASALGDTTGQALGIAAVEVIDQRAGLLDAGKLLNDVALDKYTFLRQVYLSRRLDAVYDGAPPMEAFQDEPAEPPAAAPVKPAPR